jgi:hypothetical protein
MFGIAQKQNAFKFKIAPHKQKPIVDIFLAGRCPMPLPPTPLANGALCLSTPKHNGKSGTEYTVLEFKQITIFTIPYSKFKPY